VETGEFDGAFVIEDNKDLSLIMKNFQPDFNVPLIIIILLGKIQRGLQVLLGRWLEEN